MPQTKRKKRQILGGRITTDNDHKMTQLVKNATNNGGNASNNEVKSHKNEKEIPQTTRTKCHKQQGRSATNNDEQMPQTTSNEFDKQPVISPTKKEQNVTNTKSNATEIPQTTRTKCHIRRGSNDTHTHCDNHRQ